MSVRLLSSLALLATAVLAAPEPELQKNTCGACNPQGIKTLNTPAWGPDLGTMYNDLITSVQGIHFSVLNLDGLDVLSKRSAAEIEGLRRLGKRDSPPPLCCASNTQCLLMAGLAIPFCYDKFTTNYYLPDGTYGTLNGGLYHGTGGDVNLLTGDISAGGNIYDSNPADKPNSAALNIPPQYTSSGVGGPIPITALGTAGFYTTKVTGATTIPPLTIEGTTLPATTIGGTRIPGTTISGTVISGTTVTGGSATVTLAGGGSGNKSAAAPRMIDMTPLVFQAVIVVVAALGGARLVW